MHCTRTRGWLHNHDHAREHAAESGCESGPDPGHRTHCTNRTHCAHCTHRLHHKSTPVEPTSKFGWDEKAVEITVFFKKPAPRPHMFLLSLCTKKSAWVTKKGKGCVGAKFIFHAKLLIHESRVD
jgi:hypothetical protein